MGSWLAFLGVSHQIECVVNKADNIIISPWFSRQLRKRNNPSSNSIRKVLVVQLSINGLMDCGPFSPGTLGEAVQYIHGTRGTWQPAAAP